MQRSPRIKIQCFISDAKAAALQMQRSPEPTHPISQYSVKLKFRSICNAAANSSIAPYHSAWIRSICNASEHSYEGKFRGAHAMKFNASYRMLRPQHCKCSGAHAMKFNASYRSGAHAPNISVFCQIKVSQHLQCCGQ